MARLLFQYLAVYNIENVHNSIRNLPKYAQIFCLIGEISPNLVTLVPTYKCHIRKIFNNLPVIYV